MNRRVFGDAEISSALRDLEAGVRLPEVCHRLGVSERTVNRWRREARGPDQAPAPALGLVPLTQEQAAMRGDALERQLDALRLVLHTMLEPEELERGARLVESRCQVSAQRARRLLGLAPVNAKYGNRAAAAPPAQVAPLMQQL
ncbi:MAG: transposase [Anaeromyxobacter sp.]|nr:transposase [Anaeromyxobacter sp.]MBL0274884.1 transposase [Anaeromyxobacter sp.]